MNKTRTKALFKAIERADLDALEALLDSHPEALEVTGQHNKYCRDKTPLMYAMQCSNFGMVNRLLERGANVNARMTGGPERAVLSVTMSFVYSRPDQFDQWISLLHRLLDAGTQPNDGLWPALYYYGKVVRRNDAIKACLDRGADPDRPFGSSGSTVRELVQINRALFDADVLVLFDVK